MVESDVTNVTLCLRTSTNRSSSDNSESGSEESSDRQVSLSFALNAFFLRRHCLLQWWPACSLPRCKPAASG